jgi:anthranilate phosphoribosyltransferase
VDTIPAGIGRAREALESGAAKKKLQQLVDLSKKLSA